MDTASGAAAHPGTVPRRLSAVFEELARDAAESVTVEQLRQALGDRSFATLLMFFAALNMLPLPPGSTLVLGLPLMLVSLQMALGRRSVWLPQMVLNKSVSAGQFRQTTQRLVPKLKWLERLIRPRYWPFPQGHVDRFIGLFSLILGTAVTLPIPLGNWFPACSCLLLGLALSERDGILLAIASVIGILSLLLLAFVIGAAGALAGLIF